MWVITRHKDQSIVIGDEVRVRVLDVQGDQVRLGIQAPRDIAIVAEDEPNSKTAKAARGRPADQD